MKWLMYNEPRYANKAIDLLPFSIAGSAGGGGRFGGLDLSLRFVADGLMLRYDRRLVSSSQIRQRMVS